MIPHKLILCDSSGSHEFLTARRRPRGQQGAFTTPRWGLCASSDKEPPLLQGTPHLRGSVSSIRCSENGALEIVAQTIAVGTNRVRVHHRLGA